MPKKKCSKVLTSVVKHIFPQHDEDTACPETPETPETPMYALLQNTVAIEDVTTTDMTAATKN